MTQKESVILEVTIIPHAKKNAIERWEKDRLRIRIHALPEKGKANEELICFLSEELHIAKRQIEIISGKTCRLKRLRIYGFSSIEEIRGILSLL